jgi:uncharacterized Ntn-hydrolase superfamily protein
VTFSLLGLEPESGRIGAVVASSSPAVAARCIAVRAGVGAAASQNITDPRLGPRLLDLLAAGRTPHEAVAAVVAAEPNVEYRQLTVVDAQGSTAAYSGARTLGTHACAEGSGAVAAGNLLANTGVPERMIDRFAAGAVAPLGDRFVAALRAGLAAGGEEGPVRSAGLLIAGAVVWPVADLRVDWADDPIEDLAALWQLWKPQSDEYVLRALDPAAAPGFGVPGDER